MYESEPSCPLSASQCSHENTTALKPFAVKGQDGCLLTILCNIYPGDDSHMICVNMAFERIPDASETPHRTQTPTLFLTVLSAPFRFHDTPSFVLKYLKVCVFALVCVCVCVCVSVCMCMLLCVCVCLCMCLCVRVCV